MENNWTIEKITKLLQDSNAAVEKGIVAIFNRQTADEQRIEDTRYTNNIGFSGAHAKTGTYYAKWILSGRHLDGKFLQKGRTMILHYTKQLLSIANKE